MTRSTAHRIMPPLLECLRCGKELTAKQQALNGKYCSRACIGKHGAAKRGAALPIYKMWMAMKGRCLCTANKAYRHYGGRGITVCERWHDFNNFIADVGERPLGASLDRIDNNGNYEPGNVRWASQHEQVRNCRRNRILEFEGTKMVMSDWAAKLGIPKSTLKNRLNKGWGVKEALTVPADPRYSRMAALKLGLHKRPEQMELGKK